jgi:polysaccharide biosynthesis/export protein
MKNLYLFAKIKSEMNKFFIYFFLLFVILFSSCVPSKDLIYLQNKNNSDTSSNINLVNIKPYRMQTNDVLSISIKTLDAKLSQIFSTTNTGIAQNSEQGLYFDGFTIDDHGNIRIPVLGEMNVLGFTTDEIRLKIEEKLLKDYFNKESNLFVNVKLAGFRYTINGEVGTTGTKILYQEKVNLLEAIANSGDITTTGNRKDVQIIRQFPQGTEIHSIDLTDINATKSPYYYLQPNDYIYVKPLKQKTWGTGKTGIESLGTIITLLSLITTTFLLLKK